jgi:hypothetical protein
MAVRDGKEGCGDGKVSSNTVSIQPGIPRRELPMSSVSFVRQDGGSVYTYLRQCLKTFCSSMSSMLVTMRHCLNSLVFLRLWEVKLDELNTIPPCSSVTWVLKDWKPLKH